MNIRSSIKFILSVDRSLYQKLCISFLPSIQYSLCSISHRPICLSHHHGAIANQGFLAANEGVLKKALNKMKLYIIDRTRSKMLGYYLYETIADKIPYVWFFKEMSIPDTFNSWFLVTELHVWMLMVKAMDYGTDGRRIRNFIVEAMWADVSMKGKKLGAENYSAAQEQILTLGDQFQAALLTYDEGLLSDDKVLASALWRRFFEKNCCDPEKIETMVKYVRQQMHYLDSLSEEEFRAYKINWLSLDKT